MCTSEGVVYDLENIAPFIKKFGIDPTSGKKLEAKSLITLHFKKNADGMYHCPVLFKVFNENSHIVALKTTGNVYSYEAVEQLNFKAKNFKDLLDDSPFTRADVIHLQDPQNLEKFNLSAFYHLKNNLRLEDESAKKDPRANLKHINNETRDILDTLDKEHKPPAAKVESGSEKPARDRFNAAHFSTGAAAASFTSTAVDPSTRVEAAILEDDVVRYSMVKKKGYVQLTTNHGNLNLELLCDIVPKTCENFIKLCEREYYDGSIFHRSIRNFILQGGDPTGTGRGGESAWGEPFSDEFKSHLVHQGRGVLSMANSGPNTNKSQFFITYRSCRHLDNKHTVFGKVVGGLPTLQTIEEIETDNKDRPIEEVRLIKATVFVNPFQEADDELAKKRDEEKAIQEGEELKERRRENSKVKLKTFSTGVGKYINPELKKKTFAKALQEPIPSVKKQKTSGNFGSFSDW
ncbi:peptidyl-prolyl cis-trans isomerase-like 2 isoform X3 [Varroa destructor]|nr:peptidyl-prolyl cis-trans isomerase-like 2 isoform X3 [Varroa destructor]